MLVTFLLILVMVTSAIISTRVKNKIFQALTLTAPCAFVAINAGNQDYGVYTSGFYEGNYNGLFEPGYEVLVTLLRQLGFNGYRSVLVVLSLFLFITLWRWRKGVKNVALVVMCIFIFPFVYFPIQIRFSFAILWILNSTFELIRGNKIRSAICGLLSISFHTVSMVFLLLELLAYFRLNRERSNTVNSDQRGEEFYRQYGRALLIILMITPAIGTISEFIAAALMPLFPMMAKVAYYMRSDFGIGSIAAWGLVNITDTLLYSHMMKKAKISPTEDAAVFMLFYITAYGCIFIPFLGAIAEFNRVFRLLFYIKYLMFGCMMGLINKRDEELLFIYNVAVAGGFLLVASHRGVSLLNILSTNIFSVL